ncbi:MAG: GTPase HflX [Planctomycetes bacterium]|nr:GTPase HflX [Planctomycetota bacterium]
MSRKRSASRTSSDPASSSGDVFLAGAPVVLVSGIVPDRYDPAETPLQELRRLVETLNASPVAEITQNLKAPVPASFVGAGKINEIKRSASALAARAVVFDNELTPAQQRNLENSLNLRVVDRTELILEIFALRARTSQARLQVELARHEYMLPRLRRRWTHLERQTGGIGVRGGMGEKQMEADRRRIQRRVRDLKRELARIDLRRRREVSSRGEFYTVGLVGYTNAGKTTLINALTGSSLFAEDRLFATLDTRTRLCRLGGGLEILVSDTVGFIKRVPHSLVESFLATLEEARSADLLLHVVDASEPAFRHQMEAVEEVLEEIGASDIPALVVFNKMDAVGDGIIARNFLWRRHDAVAVSALAGTGLDELRSAIRNEIVSSAPEFHVDVPLADGKAIHFLLTRGAVIHSDTDETANLMRMIVKMPRHIFDHFRRRFPHIPPLGGGAGA